MTEKLQSILEAEGLSPLLETFISAGITDAIIANLSDSDLREIGLDKLGERMRLLSAFEKASKYDVTITCPQGSGVAVVKQLRAMFDCGLADARALLEQPLRNKTWEEASQLKRQLEALGAKVDVRCCFGSFPQ